MPLGNSINNPICIEVEGPKPEFDTDCPVCLGALACGPGYPVWVNPNPNCCKKVYHFACICVLVGRLPGKHKRTETSVQPNCPTCKKKIWLDRHGCPLPWEVWSNTEFLDITRALAKSQVRRNFKCHGFVRDHQDPEELSIIEFLLSLPARERADYLPPDQLEEFEREHGLTPWNLIEE